MFIDIHVHATAVPGFPRGEEAFFSTPEQLVARYDAVGIEKGVILPCVSPECAYLSQSSEGALEICRRFPDRFVPFCNVDPRALTNSPDAPLREMLAYYRDKGCKGVGEVMANLPFSDPRVQNLFGAAQEVGMPLTFHVAAQIGGLYGLYDDAGLPQFEQSLKRFPGLKFLGHSQTFWAEMAPLSTPADRYGYPAYPVAREGVVPRLFRRYENLYGDLSAGSGCNALKRDPDYAVEFLNEFQDRLLFGTDITSPGTPTPLVDFLKELREADKITDDVFRKVARENAIELLGLS